MKARIWTSLIATCLLAPTSILQASPILWTLSPSTLTVVAGQTVTSEVELSGKPVGIPPSIGAFDFDVAFNPALLSPVNVAFGPFLGIPGTEALTAFQILPGILDFAEVSLLASAELDAIQPASFVLATLSFSAIGSGTTSLAFSQEIVDDAFGNKIPEPSTIGLFALGIGGLIVFRTVRGRRPRRVS